MEKKDSTLNNNNNVSYSFLQMNDEAISEQETSSCDVTINITSSPLEDQCTTDYSNTTYFQRLQIIFLNSLPIIISYLLSIGGSLVILYFAGVLSSRQQDNNIFAGVSLGNMFSNVNMNYCHFCI